MKPSRAFFLFATSIAIFSPTFVLAQSQTESQQQSISRVGPEQTAVTSSSSTSSPNPTESVQPTEAPSTLLTSYTTSTSSVNSAELLASSSFYAPISTQTVSQTNSAAGASGSSNAFQIGKGGLIAIGVVIGAVVFFGITTTALYITAKRRQWEVRKSIIRASKRVIGRGSSPEEDHRDRRRTRVTASQGVVRLQSPPSYMKSQRDMEKIARAKAETLEMGQR